MPCRALEAFRHRWLHEDAVVGSERVLMPCRALEAFRRRSAGQDCALFRARLNALSGIGGVQTEVALLYTPRVAAAS